MMMGELEYTSIFEGPHKLIVTSRLIFLVFIILASVVLMNLLVGLAVKDIDTLQQEGHVRRLEKQAEFIRQLEMVISLKILHGWWVPKFMRKIMNWTRNSPTIITIQPDGRCNVSKQKWHADLPYEVIGKNTLFISD